MMPMGNSTPSGAIRDGTEHPLAVDTPMTDASAPAAPDAPVVPKGASFRHLVSEVIKNSVADNFEDAAKEWSVFFFDRAEQPDECVCGHPRIMDRYAIRNVHTNAVLWPVGNVCIRHFENQRLTKEARGVRELTKLKALSDSSSTPLALRRGEPGWGSRGRITRNDIALLKRLGALTEDEHEVVIRAFNARKPQQELLDEAHEIVEDKVRPWLAAWNRVA